MKKILHVLSGNKTFSGVASYLYQQYLRIDRSKIQYDFFLCKENSMELVMSDPIFQDSKFYIINARMKKTGSTNYYKIIHELDKILSEVHYDAVVVNTSVIMIIYSCLRVVKKHKGIQFIAHAHNSNLVLNRGALREKISPIVNVVEFLLRKKIRNEAFALFGCSREAGEATFGHGASQLKKFIVVRNAIDIEKFQFDNEIAMQVRKEMQVAGDTFIIGNVGRLAKIKNQSFLIELLSVVKNRNNNTKLWLIGEGPDKDKLEVLAKELNVDEDVIFLGQKSDVFRYMQAMNVFVFPSISEGLGIVAIEAQAAGLPVIISNGVPSDVLLTPLARKVPLEKGVEKWADELISLYSKYPKHIDYSDMIINGGYDIVAETKRIAEYYLNRV
ncbi:MAG: glycosyltransferase [Eubacterium sp.]|nr:glycosyltransferase [Eubacterium sp.]